MTHPRCPALLVSAPASGQGKTTLTAALARLHASQGRHVRVFKTGPDFLDPMILERASGHPVYQLDLWMGGEAHCRGLLSEAAAAADLILIEGVMGLFDGTPSSADLARRFGVPVLVVIDAEAMAQSFGAIAYGLAHYREGLPFLGVLANQVAGERHAELVKEGMPPGLRFLGSLARDAQLELPDRHLGLVQAAEVADLEERLNAAASRLAGSELSRLPPAVEFDAGEERSAGEQSLDSSSSPPPPSLAGVRIGIARDSAFSFLYQANLDLLRALGAELVFFSPLHDSGLPDVDSVYLPGGYPELHLEGLNANRGLAEALRVHLEAGKPLYAECGGMLYLLESLTDVHGRRGALAGILPGHGLMHERLKGLGYQSAPLPGGTVRGHTFHHSTIETPLVPAAHGERAHGGSAGEAIYWRKRLVVTYFHSYFPSNPSAAAALFLP
jgi:cobyrinic acid a,c-diamide synthase